MQRAILCQLGSSFVRRSLGSLTPATAKGFSTQSPLFLHVTRLPYDDRYPPTPLDFWEAEKGAWLDYDPKNDPDSTKEGGGDYGINEPGYELDGEFIFVREMVPDYVVPDLQTCNISPYVPYNAKKVSQVAFTAEDLFETCYRHIVELNARQLVESEEPVNSLGELSEKLFEERSFAK